MNTRYQFHSGELQLDLAPGKMNPAVVMGILNVTPDSFSDGGLYATTSQAVSRAEAMITEGASIIDVGGASSRPKGSVYGKGASAVSPAEESKRILPVIREISNRWPTIMISVDTSTASVANQALDAGAHIVNDITALGFDPRMTPLVAERDIPVILMHSLGAPGEMPHVHTYDRVVDSVLEHLRAAAERALNSGISQLILDPGFGFGKSTEDNMALIASTGAFVSLGWPIMVGVSRKSTIGRVLGTEEKMAPVSDRLYGSLGATAVAVMEGARIVRTHDVRATKEMLTVLHKSSPVTPPDR